MRREITMSETEIVANQSMLLIDETLIGSEHGITREVIPGLKSEPLLEPEKDRPWEDGGPGLAKRVALHGTVLHSEEDGKYRMWYACRMGPHWRLPHTNYEIPGLYIPRTDEKPYAYRGATTDRYGRRFVDNDRGDLVCYAESTDGVSWVKPDLGVFAFSGNPNNNIVSDFHGVSVFLDEEEANPARRYKAIGFCRRYRGVFLLTSADGIHWNEAEHLEPVANKRNEGPFNVTYDPRDRLYRAYGLCRYDDENRRRVIGYTQSESLEGPWKELQPAFEPTSWDDEIARRKSGAMRAEFHNLSAFRYHNIHLGLLCVLYVTAEKIPDEKNQMPCKGPMEVQFVYSRDGILWQHADRSRTPAIPRGEPGTYDLGRVSGTATKPLIQGDDVHWYFTGNENSHGELDMAKHVSRIARATWKRDRFVALTASGDGMIETRPLRVPAGACGLEINADAAGGEIRVELCGADGSPIPGYSRDACVPVSTDEIHQNVVWHGGDFPEERLMRLRVYLNRAIVFSVTFRGDGRR